MARDPDDGELPRSVTLGAKGRARWLGLGRVRLWQAVVLSFDVDPDLVPTPSGDVHRIAFTSTKEPDVSRYRVRLELAESHAGDALKMAEIVPSENGHKCASLVRLWEFGAWLHSEGIKPPSWFPSHAGAGYAGGPVAELRNPRPANWPKWRHTGLCELWQGVLLTLDIEPDAFTAHELGMGVRRLQTKPGFELLTADDWTAIWERVELSYSNRTDLFEEWDEFDDKRLTAAIRLSKFSAWAASVWEPLPPQLPGLPGEVPSPTENDLKPLTDVPEKPLSTRSRNTLLAIIGLLARRANIPVDNPYTGAEHLMRMVETMDLRGLNKNTVAEILKESEAALADKKK